MVKKNRGLMRPVVIYPFRDKGESTDEHISVLLEFLAWLSFTDPGQYAPPVIMLNRQTYYRTRSKFPPELGRAAQSTGTLFPPDYDARTIPVWSVDSCQLWLAGLGHAFDRAVDERDGELVFNQRADGGKSPDPPIKDIFWLIPGDFEYGELKHQLDVLRAKPGVLPSDNFFVCLKGIPEAVRGGSLELCVGEIELDRDNAKELIDTHGTFAMLANWFSEELQKIWYPPDSGSAARFRKPRSEFLAIGGDFLADCLVNERWFGYEQTVMILLKAVREKRNFDRIPLAGIKDDPHGRESLEGTLEQIERMERAIRQRWRELHCGESDWQARYLRLDAASAEIRRAAITMLRQYLRVRE